MLKLKIGIIYPRITNFYSNKKPWWRTLCTKSFSMNNCSKISILLRYYIVKPQSSSIFLNINYWQGKYLSIKIVKKSKLINQWNKKQTLFGWNGFEFVSDRVKRYISKIKIKLIINSIFFLTWVLIVSIDSQKYSWIRVRFAIITSIKCNFICYS